MHGLVSKTVVSKEQTVTPTCYLFLLVTSIHWQIYHFQEGIYEQILFVLFLTDLCPLIKYILCTEILFSCIINVF